MNDPKDYKFEVEINPLRMHREKMKFCLSTHNKNSIRNAVQDVVEKTSFFISNLFTPYLIVELKKVIKDENILQLIINVLESNKNPFANFDTEKRRLSIFRSDSIYVDPDEFSIGNKNVETSLNTPGS